MTDIAKRFIDAARAMKAAVDDCGSRPALLVRVDGVTGVRLRIELSKFLGHDIPIEKISDDSFGLMRRIIVQGVKVEWAKWDEP